CEFRLILSCDGCPSDVHFVRLSGSCAPDAAPAHIYTLSLHDALPICSDVRRRWVPTTRWGELPPDPLNVSRSAAWASPIGRLTRSEEHTSELQSRENLVCRLLLEKKKSVVPARGLSIATLLNLTINMV